MDRHSSPVDLSIFEAKFKKDKSRAKANFTRFRNKLILLLKKHEIPSRVEVLEACDKMDNYFRLAVDIFTNFSDMYIKVNERQKSMRLFNEMEKIENEYHSTNAKAMEYLESRQDDRSSAASEILSID